MNEEQGALQSTNDVLKNGGQFLRRPTGALCTKAASIVQIEGGQPDLSVSKAQTFTTCCSNESLNSLSTSVLIYKFMITVLSS